MGRDVKIGYISDIHFSLYDDDATLREWQIEIINHLSRNIVDIDILVIAGDVSETVDGIIDFIRRLPSGYRFNRKTGKDVDIIFVPGNHELWNREDKKYKSIDEKFQIIQEELIKVSPNIHFLYRNTVTLHDIVFGGIMGWYHLPKEIRQNIQSKNSRVSIEAYNTLDNFSLSSNDSRYIFPKYENMLGNEMVDLCQEEYDKDCIFLKQNGQINVLISHVPLAEKNLELSGRDLLYRFSPNVSNLGEIKYNICGHTHLGGVSLFKNEYSEVIVLNNPLMSSNYHISGKVHVLNYEVCE